MSNEASNQMTTIASSFWQRMVGSLFAHHPSIIDVGEKRQAYLVAVITLLLTFTTALGAIIVFLLQGMTRGLIILTVTAITSAIGYALSRGPSFRLGGYVIILALTIAAFSDSRVENISNSLYTSLIPAVIIAGFLFSFQYLVVFTVLINVLIGFLPFLYPEYSDIGIIFAVFFPLCILVLATRRYRDNVERDRLAELLEANRELTTLSNDLELGVQERTSSLERRARQLQVVTEVAQTAASYQNLEQLLSDSTRLIAEDFGFYHVAIFMQDEEEINITLRASNSAGGQKMLSEKYTLPIDIHSIVGHAAKTLTIRIIRDAETDVEFVENPNLPETRSEIAVPLKVGLRLIGVLDIQSKRIDAFSEDDISVVGALANQLAVAIENTRLLAATRNALVESEQTYQRYVRQAWSQFSQRLEQDEYRYESGQIIAGKRESNNNKSEQDATRLNIPLFVRGQEIGVLNVQPRLGERKWSTDEITLVEAAAERTALALENARLLEDSQRRASLERTIGEMTSRIGATTKVDAILRATVQELGHQLGDAEIVLELENDLEEETGV